MVSYALRTVEDRRVRTWFYKMNQKLRNPAAGVPFVGAVRHLGRGVYVLTVESVVTRFAYYVGPIMLGFGALVSWAFNLVVLAQWLLGLASFFALAVSVLLSPGLHRAVIRLSLWRLLKRRVSVVPASEEVLRRCSYGRS